MNARWIGKLVAWGFWAAISLWFIFSAHLIAIGLGLAIFAVIAFIVVPDSR